MGELALKKTAHSSAHRRQLLPFLLDRRSEVHSNQYCEQFSAAGKRRWQSSALVRPTKTLNTDLAPIGDDIEPIEVPREDVGMGNDEDEEPLEAEVLRARMNPKNPTSREKQEHEDSGHDVYRNWCAGCVEGRGAGGRDRIVLLDEEERK